MERIMKSEKGIVLPEQRWPSEFLNHEEGMRRLKDFLLGNTAAGEVGSFELDLREGSRRVWDKPDAALSLSYAFYVGFNPEAQRSIYLNVSLPLDYPIEDYPKLHAVFGSETEKGDVPIYWLDVYSVFDLAHPIPHPSNRMKIDVLGRKIINHGWRSLGEQLLADYRLGRNNVKFDDLVSFIFRPHFSSADSSYYLGERAAAILFCPGKYPLVSSGDILVADPQAGDPGMPHYLNVYKPIDIVHGELIASVPVIRPAHEEGYQFIKEEGVLIDAEGTRWRDGGVLAKEFGVAHGTADRRFGVVSTRTHNGSVFYKEDEALLALGMFVLLPWIKNEKEITRGYLDEGGEVFMLRARLCNLFGIATRTFDGKVEQLRSMQVRVGRTGIERTLFSYTDVERVHSTKLSYVRISDDQQRYINAAGDSWVSIQYLADVYGLSRTTILKKLGKLLQEVPYIRGRLPTHRGRTVALYCEKDIRNLLGEPVDTPRVDETTEQYIDSSGRRWVPARAIRDLYGHSGAVKKAFSLCSLIRGKKVGNRWCKLVCIEEFEEFMRVDKKEEFDAEKEWKRLFHGDGWVED